MSAKLPVRDAVSAGGVVWRRTGAGVIEIALCETEAHTWMLPKGTPDAGEAIEATAVREVLEETGLEVRMSEPLPTIRYWFVQDGTRYHKRVHYWLMEATGGDVANHDHEFARVDWLPIGEAHRLVQFVTQREVVAAAAQKLGVEIPGTE